MPDLSDIKAQTLRLSLEKASLTMFPHGKRKAQEPGIQMVSWNLGVCLSLPSCPCAEGRVEGTGGEPEDNKQIPTFR